MPSPLFGGCRRRRRRHFNCRNWSTTTRNPSGGFRLDAAWVAVAACLALLYPTPPVCVIDRSFWKCSVVGDFVVGVVSSLPACPVDYATKDWVEDSLHLLGSVFGNGALRDTVVIEPTDEFFPDAYEPSLEGAQNLLEQTARYVNTSSEGLGVRLVPQRDELWLAEDADFEASTSTDTPNESPIQFAVEQDDLNAPDLLVGMYSRELAGLRLIEEVGVNPDAYDLCPLADLTATFLGMGLFIGALPEVEPERVPGNSRPIPLVLSAQALGYALAHVAWHQEDLSPKWVSYLKPDVKACVKLGLRFLDATGESDFPPRDS